MHAHRVMHIEIVLLGHPVRIGDLCVDGVAQTPDTATRQLAVKVHRIDDLADVCGDKSLVQFDPVFGHGDFNHLRTRHAEGFDHCYSVPAALWQGTAPI